MTDTVQHGAASIAKGSKSFAAAARLFDPATRDAAVMLYAWCRHCDDVVDGQEDGYRGDAADASTDAPQSSAPKSRPPHPEVLGKASIHEAPQHEARGKNPFGPGSQDEKGGGAGDAASRLATLEAQTRAVLAGEPAADPAFAGLGLVATRHAIPERLFFQHLAGFRMDVEGRRYEFLSDTVDYGYHVAGVVGVMMAHLMGVRDSAVLDRASDLGIAFQLTNIARDIVEDAEHGRVYLPAEWLREEGLPEAAIADPHYRPQVARVAARLLDAAEPYYASARIGIRALPPRSAWAIATALGVYRQIGITLRARGERGWDRRVSTTKAEKIGHVARGGAVALATRLPSRKAPPARTGLYRRPA